jgi:hypothetical protein
VAWSNDKWKMLTRNQGLNDLENELDLLAWIQDGPVDKAYNLGFRHSSTRYSLAKTRIVAGTTDRTDLTILTAQPPLAVSPPDTLYSPILEVDEFDLEDDRDRRSTIVPSNRLSTSTEFSVHSNEHASASSSTGSYFPGQQSQRSSSAKVRTSRNSKRSIGERALAYTAQMNDATVECWNMMESVDWSKTKCGPRAQWNEVFDGLMAVVFQSPSQDSIWIGEDLQILQ